MVSRAARLLILEQMMIRFIIFDMAGVLCSKVHSPMIREISLKSEIDFNELYSYNRKLFDKALLGEITESEMYARLIQRFGLHLKVRDIARIASKNLEPIPEMWNLVEELKGKYQLALISDMGLEWAKEREDRFNLSSHFIAITWSFAVHSVKTEERIFHATLEKLDAKPQECVFIDDKKENVQKAASLGFRAIRCYNPKQVRNRLKDLGVILS